MNSLLDGLLCLREEKSRSISPENFTGEKGEWLKKERGKMRRESWGVDGKFLRLWK